MKKPVYHFQSLAISCVGLGLFPITLVASLGLLAYALGMGDSWAIQVDAGNWEKVGWLALPIKATFAGAAMLSSVGLSAFLSWFCMSLFLVVACMVALGASSWIGARADLAWNARRSLNPEDIANREASALKRLAKRSTKRGYRQRL